MSARSAGTAALLCTLGFASSASSATEERPVAIGAAGCPDRWQAAWQEVMRVELGARLVEDPAPPKGAGQRGRPLPSRPGEEIDQVTVACAGHRATITARPASGQAPVVHELSLTEIPEDAGPRLVALVAIELVTAGPHRPPPFAAIPPPVAAVAPPVAATTPASSRVLLGGGPRVFLAAGGLQVWGGAVRWQPRVRAGWGASFDIDVGAAGRAVEQGRVSELLASIGGALELRRASALGSLEAGLGGRLGFARLAGEPLAPSADAWKVGDINTARHLSAGKEGDINTARHLSAGKEGDINTARHLSAGRAVVRPWAGPFAFAALVVEGRQLCGALAVEAGYAAVGARGLVDDAVVSAVAGPWLGLSLSGGLQVE